MSLSLSPSLPLSVSAYPVKRRSIAWYQVHLLVESAAESASAHDKGSPREDFTMHTMPQEPATATYNCKATRSLIAPVDMFNVRQKP